MTSRVQTDRQEYILPGGHILLSEYFQSSDRKQKYDEATNWFLCSNLLLWCSGQAGLQDIMVTAGKGVYCQMGYQGKSGDVWGPQGIKVDVKGCQGLSGYVRRFQGMSGDVMGCQGI